MPLARRQFLTRTGVALSAGTVAVAQGLASAAAETAAPLSLQDAGGGIDWNAVRAQFALSDDYIHMSAMLISSHPKPVRDAIEEYRRELDANPVVYLQENDGRLRADARSAAGDYVGTDAVDIALTDSTTMGIGLVYNGLRLNSGDEILSTEQDYFVTHEAIRQASERTGATVKTVSLYDDIQNVTQDEIVERIASAVTPATRVVAVTWVHSSTGLKIPVRQIADALKDINVDRDNDSRVLLCVDGVHGFGCEDFTLSDLGCDFLMAGCHKWLFGPRGTGIVAGTPNAWASLIPSIPSFIDDGTWEAWLFGRDSVGPTTADRMTPGGFKPFEHQWAMTPAFEFHRIIGKARVAERTHELAGQLKEGLAGMPDVTLHTPRSAELSAGIVSFDVDGLTPSAVVHRLRERRIVASVAPYATPHVRLTPSIRNTPDEIETALRELRAAMG